ncbi:MFS general substrate transporter [Dothidotthia symphoricarpi CBS 119687]|uniref:MFS general substrate transporter n=1 Tax=Dothidotthia symphoricarpi CBS 119687 TaxID=1392245 RepID=A0A6A6A402_9PLEO|nr:MFS general substrate transporter [Dothidotthia symphoricarpi CBS 119687]KAF2125844.1 MFS general substrate transporter [Dothidotthia symphoricarpi CBS 119687]
MSKDPELAKDDLEVTSSLSSSRNYAAPIQGSNHELNFEHEKALCWKFDLRILPMLALMYLFNALDKGNLGNAKTDGMDKDLGFKGNQYNTMLSIFYVPYVIFAPPIGMLGKKYGPNRVLPIMMFCFGSFTLLASCVHNWSGMMALRWFLGMAESAFFPLVIYYLTTFYRRGELARRLAIFYAASNIANAFSGLLAFGVFQIKSSLDSWRFLFIIEGSLTVCFSFFAYWYLPKNSYEASFLTEAEKKLAYARIQVDSSAVVNEKFNLRDSLAIFKMPATYGFLAIEVCLGVPLQSVSLFLPQIVQRLGYNKVKTNLYTVAPNVVGAVVLLILAFASDYTRLRFPFIALGFLLTFVGFVIYATIDVANSLTVAYFACFMMTWGTSAPSVLLSTWYNNNVADENRRVTLTSIGVPLANLMGVVSSNIFRTQDAPKYIPALATTAAFGAMGSLCALLLGVYMTIDNKRRNKKQGVNLTARDVSTEKLRDGPKNPDFRWFLWSYLIGPRHHPASRASLKSPVTGAARSCLLHLTSTILQTTSTSSSLSIAKLDKPARVTPAERDSPIMAVKAMVPVLVGMMLLTGCCNTLLTKYQDMQCVGNCDSPTPKYRKHFEQPVLQTLQMFIGEMGCWLVIGAFTLWQRYASHRAGYETIPNNPSGGDSATLGSDGSDTAEVANPLKPAHADDEGRIPLEGKNIFLLALPACCDIAGTTLMNVGLLFVAASIYQMTRGALVLFVGLFSVWFLKRHLGLYKWFSLFVVVFGVAIVGLAGATTKDDKATPSHQSLHEMTADPIKSQAVMTVIGIALIAGAQIFTATQFVLEEKIMAKYAMEPIKVVGWEGVFGFLVTAIGMVILHLTIGTGYFNAKEGFYQMTHSRAIAVSSILIMISIGGFNFFGLSVTRTVSATSRSTIDTCRTLFIWVFSLGLGWETFKWLQVVGFAALVYGTFLFNDLIQPPLKACVERKPEPLLVEDPIEHH